ncbi:MAG TPA: hypothetical protein DCG90_07020 [Sphingobium sp.]|uniref:hypothetical protein n=1 Tax=unclassified Sphingobium TaxID=2611147 RepID=UPI000ED4FCA3|nr:MULTISPECIES: hypothetical protein [unclassified Sphingobium]WIW88828.1 hypothetical protein K3M67_02265 [Sphingobium sp. V4]HAF41500.1 hypothetical protein [Sphingobium sp.]
MSVTRRFLGRISLVSLVVLAACSTPKPPPPPPAPPPPVVPTIRPTPPNNAAEGMSLPTKDEEGAYLTPNRKVTSNTALWHVRMALNVAALNCERYGSTARLQYNQILTVHKAVLTDANAAVDRNYKVAYGRAGVGSREQLNTIVYNFFALPPVIKSFCPVATAVGTKILAMPSGALLAYAPEALKELEKPYQEFYAAYADYLRRLAEWQSRFGGTVTVVVSPTPLPPPPVPPGEAPPPGGWSPSYTTALEKAPPPPADAPATPAPSLSGPPPVVPTLPGAAPRLMVQPLPTPSE